jgi:hypothetical protein
MDTVDRLRLVTGAQLERLCFVDLVGRSRSVMRWRVLKRLTDWRVLLALPRRIGGTPRGSAGSVYALDTAGQALANRAADDVRAQRRPGLPGDRFIQHVLAVSELYVQLVDAARDGRLELLAFQAEPACWWPDGRGGLLKPDACAVLAAGDVEDTWWFEVDRATEHLPTLRRKLETYLDFHARGQLGPRGVMPRVLLSVPDEHRYETVQAMLDRLSAPATALLHVRTAAETIPHVIQVLRE